MNAIEFNKQYGEVLRNALISRQQLDNATQVSDAFHPLIACDDLDHVAFARTSVADYVLLTTTGGAVFGATAETDGLIGVQGWVGYTDEADSTKVQVAFREDTRVPRLNMALSAHLGTDVTEKVTSIGAGGMPSLEAPDQLLESEILDNVTDIKEVRPSFWTETRLVVSGGNKSGVSIRIDRGSLLGIFGIKDGVGVVFDAHPESTSLDLNDAYTIPSAGGHVPELA